MLHPSARHTPARPHAFTLYEIAFILAALITVLLIAVPVWIRANIVAGGWTCQENLVKIEEAKRLWAIQQDAHDGDAIGWPQIVGPGLSLKEQLTCPAGGAYKLNALGTPCSCDYQIPDWLEGPYRHTILPTIK